MWKEPTFAAILGLGDRQSPQTFSEEIEVAGIFFDTRRQLSLTTPPTRTRRRQMWSYISDAAPNALALDDILSGDFVLPRDSEGECRVVVCLGW